MKAGIGRFFVTQRFELSSQRGAHEWGKGVKLGVLIRSEVKLDPKGFFAAIGKDKRVTAFSRGKIIFAQGETADAIFYIQKGKIRLAVVSKVVKEATSAYWSRDSFSENAPWRASICASGRNRNVGL